MKLWNNKGAWLWSAAAVLALAALWLLIDRFDAPPDVNRPASPSDSRGLSPAAGDAGLLESGANSPARNQGSAFRAWEALDESMVDPLPSYKEIVEGRALVRLPAVEEWPTGGELAFEVPQLGRAFMAVVERVEDDVWGNRSLVGLLREPEGGEYRFVITLGARNQFAYFGTSRGSFELVASDGLGWLMPTANMDRHVDYSRPDYLIRQRPRSR